MIRRQVIARLKVADNAAENKAIVKEQRKGGTHRRLKLYQGAVIYIKMD